MSIGPAIARQVARAAPQGRAVKVARALMETASVRAAISGPSQARLINRWWAGFGPFETAIAGNTGNSPCTAADLQAVAASSSRNRKTIVRAWRKSNRWWIEFGPITSELENAAGNTGNADNPKATIPGVGRLRARA